MTTSNRLDDEQRALGLYFARNSNFTDEQYEEALKRIDRPDNLNQLIPALLDVSNNQTEPKSSDYGPGMQSQTNQDLSYDQSSTSIDTTTLTDLCGAESFSCSSSGASSLLSISSKSISYQTGSSASIPKNSLECLSQQQNLIAFDSPNELQLEGNPQAVPTSSSRAAVTVARANSSSSLACKLRPIYVDGSNVARTYGREAAFSWIGIEKCVQWFRSRRHVVRVLVPEDKIAKSRDKQELEAIAGLGDVLDKTPAGCNDDLMIIKAAMESGGIIVSNDLFRDERRWLSDEQNHYVAMNRLPYAFINERFIPAEDPLGRTGPNLDQFLRVQAHTDSTCSYQKLGRTKSHQPNIQRNYPRANNHIYRQSQQQDYRSYRQTHSWQGSERPTSIFGHQNASNDARHDYNSRSSFVYSTSNHPVQRHAPNPNTKRDSNESEGALNKMRGNFNTFWRNNRNT